MGKTPAGATGPTLAAWIGAQEQRAATYLFGAISATHLVKRRPGFGQIIVPAPGSVLASAVDADWDPEPDYFFHWLRDAALAMDAVRLLRAWPRYSALASWELEQYVSFSHRISQVRGAARLAKRPLHEGVAPEFRQYLRSADDISSVRGDGARGDVRFNADGAIDISRWSRPQFDGVALRALGLLRCMDRRDASDWAELVAGDLDCIARNAIRPCVDIWEEERGWHLHAMLTQYAALREGAAWARGGARDGQARIWDMTADDLLARLAAFRREEDGWIISRITALDGPPVNGAKLLDASVILGVLHAGLAQGAFSVADPLVHGTLARLEAHFAEAFPLNHRRTRDCAPSLGRNPADVYFDGGAWPLITLAAAELRYRLALALVAGGGAQLPQPDPRLWFSDEPAASAADAAQRLFAAGDMGLAAVRAVTPDDGAMPEQVDRATGAPRSARALTWSHAAFLAAADARRRAALTLRRA